MLVSALWMAVLAVYAWRHRAAPGATPLVGVTALAALLALVSAFELSAENLATKMDWFLLRTLTWVPIGVSGLWFVLQYAGLDRRATPGLLGLLLSPLLLQLAFYLIVPDHALLWTRRWADGLVRAEPGPVSVAMAIYTVSLFATCLAITLALWVRAPRQRASVAAILLGLLAVIGLFGLQNARLVTAPLNLTVLAADAAGLAFLVAVARFRFFTRVPIACETVFERARDGILVLDVEDRVADVNPAAEQLLGLTRRALSGLPFAQAVRHVPRLLDLQDAATVTEVEVEVGEPTTRRIYRASIAPLTGARGHRYGRLLMLQDITELKRTQQRLNQELRVLATLQERERMARELHDALAQELAYLNLQAQAARAFLAAGQTAQVDDCLADMAGIAQQAHADVRGLIAGLLATIAPEGGLPGALAALVVDFRTRYGIQAEFIGPDEAGALVLEPAVAMQLLRIVQEALANVRKHACAQHVQVRLTHGPDIQVTIEDDGCGFDPAALAVSGQTFGLAIMRERAEDIGATLDIASTPGGGTRVTIQLRAT